jgi:hypothetical protein
MRQHTKHVAQKGITDEQVGGASTFLTSSFFASVRKMEVYRSEGFEEISIN